MSHPTGPPSEWSVEDVYHWISSVLKFPQHALKFVDGEVDGRALALLTPEDFKSDGLDIKLGPRKVILASIKDLFGSSQKAHSSIIIDHSISSTPVSFVKAPPPPPVPQLVQPVQPLQSLPVHQPIEQHIQPIQPIQIQQIPPSPAPIQPTTTTPVNSSSQVQDPKRLNTVAKSSGTKKKTKWTEAEDSRLFELAQVHKKQWEIIAPQLSRSVGACRSRFAKISSKRAKDAQQTANPQQVSAPSPAPRRPPSTRPLLAAPLETESIRAPSPPTQHIPSSEIIQSALPPIPRGKKRKASANDAARKTRAKRSSGRRWSKRDLKKLRDQHDLYVDARTGRLSAEKWAEIAKIHFPTRSGGALSSQFQKMTKQTSQSSSSGSPTDGTLSRLSKNLTRRRKRKKPQTPTIRPGTADAANALSSDSDSDSDVSMNGSGDDVVMLGYHEVNSNGNDVVNGTRQSAKENRERVNARRKQSRESSMTSIDITRQITSSEPQESLPRPSLEKETPTQDDDQMTNDSEQLGHHPEEKDEILVGTPQSPRNPPTPTPPIPEDSRAENDTQQQAPSSSQPARISNTSQPTYRQSTSSEPARRPGFQETQPPPPPPSSAAQRRSRFDEDGDTRMEERPNKSPTSNRPRSTRKRSTPPRDSNVSSSSSLSLVPVPTTTTNTGAGNSPNSAASRRSTQSVEFRCDAQMPSEAFQAVVDIVVAACHDGRCHTGSTMELQMTIEQCAVDMLLVSQDDEAFLQTIVPLSKSKNVNVICHVDQKTVYELCKVGKVDKCGCLAIVSVDKTTKQWRNVVEFANRQNSSRRKRTLMAPQTQPVQPHTPNGWQTSDPYSSDYQQHMFHQKSSTSFVRHQPGVHALQAQFHQPSVAAFQPQWFETRTSSNHAQPVHPHVACGYGSPYRVGQTNYASGTQPTSQDYSNSVNYLTTGRRPNHFPNPRPNKRARYDTCPEKQHSSRFGPHGQSQRAYR